jgi:hypothetical protein
MMLIPTGDIIVPKKGNIPWNKGKKMSTETRIKMSESRKGKTPWNKGLTKEIAPSLANPPMSEEQKRKLSEDRKGHKNPMFGVAPSKESRELRSKHMKELIRSGKFTPNIHNSRTHWQCTYNGVKFRSSWEAAFYAMTDNLEYEKHRIEYIDTESKKTRVYITDFTDEINKIIYEIKPNIHLKSSEAKISAAISWCDKNNYEFKIIDESWFAENKEAIMESGLSSDIKKRLVCVGKNIENSKS